MAMLRGSYRYQVLQFEAEQRRRQNEEMGESSPVEDLVQSTQHLSMSEQTLGSDTDFHKVQAASLKTSQHKTPPRLDFLTTSKSNSELTGFTNL